MRMVSFGLLCVGLVGMAVDATPAEARQNYQFFVPRQRIVVPRLPVYRAPVIRQPVFRTLPRVVQPRVPIVKPRVPYQFTPRISTAPKIAKPIPQPQIVQRKAVTRYLQNTAPQSKPQTRTIAKAPIATKPSKTIGPEKRTSVAPTKQPQTQASQTVRSTTQANTKPQPTQQARTVTVPNNSKSATTATINKALPQQTISTKNAHTTPEVIKQQPLAALKSAVPAKSPFVPLEKKATVANLIERNPNKGLQGECGEYVRKVVPQYTGTNLALPSADVKDWYKNAQSKNMTLPASNINQVPPGALVVWKGIDTKTGQNTMGHVAVIVANDGKSLKLAESNWHGDKQFSTTTLPYNCSASGQCLERHGGHTKWELQGFILPTSPQAIPWSSLKIAK